MSSNDSGTALEGGSSEEDEDDEESSEEKSQGSMKSVEQNIGMRVGPILEKVSLGKGEVVVPNKSFCNHIFSSSFDVKLQKVVETKSKSLYLMRRVPTNTSFAHSRDPTSNGSVVKVTLDYPDVVVSGV